MNKTIKAVMWDLDGTLLNSGEIHYNTEKAVLEKFGLHFNKVIYKKYLSTKVEDLVSEIIIEQGSDVKPAEVINMINERSVENYKHNISLFPGIIQVLRSIAQKYKQGLATAREKKFALISINRFDLKKYFDAAVFAEDVTQGKPSPEIFLKCAEEMQIEPRHCLVVEDGLNGVLAAKSAGMIAVAKKASHNKDIDFSIADHILVEPDQIIDILNLY